MPASIDDIRTAQQRFLIENPHVQKELYAITPFYAEFMGEDLEQLRQYHLATTMERSAWAKNMDMIEYQILFGVDDPRRAKPPSHRPPQGNGRCAGI
ncbi:DUF6388 family protein [Crenobacter cavernae]|uniref:Uncharacterized protein n=1 Tax=Crenobacter cavernae TaxID=2290923 RepID=A0A345Y3Y3_9NEIS|nr:DUF6388 family protein [Crenobacter cavernae]AXK38635.1 hypothetical protein DWG20_03890 [Crenobacter cavernae]